MMERIDLPKDWSLRWENGVYVLHDPEGNSCGAFFRTDWGAAPEFAAAMSSPPADSALVTLLTKWYRIFKDENDKGPHNEGWQSQELIDLIAQTEQALAGGSHDNE